LQLKRSHSIGHLDGDKDDMNGQGTTSDEEVKSLELDKQFSVIDNDRE